MKGENLQSRIIYPARLSFRFDGRVQKFYGQAKTKRVQHHQTDFITSVKGTSLGESERPQLETRKLQNEKAHQ